MSKSKLKMVKYINEIMYTWHIDTFKALLRIVLFRNCIVSLKFIVFILVTIILSKDWRMNFHHHWLTAFFTRWFVNFNMSLINIWCSDATVVLTTLLYFIIITNAFSDLHYKSRGKIMQIIRLAQKKKLYLFITIYI